MATRNRWNKWNIRAKLKTDFKWCRRALIVLYQRQTADEQSATRTKHDNDRGFNQPDARRGSELARKAMTPVLFEPWEVIEARKLLMKYAGQLARIANEKERAAKARPVTV
jgi:hypothetical protein